MLQPAPHRMLDADDRAGDSRTRKIENRSVRLPHMYLAVVYYVVITVIAYNIKARQVSEHRVFGFVFFFFLQGSIFCQLR